MEMGDPTTMRKVEEKSLASIAAKFVLGESVDRLKE